jgi:hypothetical protein
MSSTFTTPVNDRLSALRDELAAIYSTDGAKPMFAAAVPAARRHGITELWHLIYVVYRVADARYAITLIASAVAQYAAAALIDDLQGKPEGISDAQRCAYIAVVTLLQFRDLDDWGGLDADELTEDDYLQFRAFTATIANVKGVQTDDGGA